MTHTTSLVVALSVLLAVSATAADAPASAGQPEENATSVVSGTVIESAAKTEKAKVPLAQDAAAFVDLRKGFTPEGVLSLEVKWQELIPPVGSERPKIWLIGTVHIADLAFYQDVQQRLDEVDLVLYELVQDAEQLPPLPKSGGLQTPRLWAQALGLALQNTSINYDRPHFRNSDFSATEFAKELGLRFSRKPRRTTASRSTAQPKVDGGQSPREKGSRDRSSGDGPPADSGKKDRLSLSYSGLSLAEESAKQYSFLDALSDDPGYVAKLEQTLAPAERSALVRAALRTRVIHMMAGSIKPRKRISELDAKGMTKPLEGTQVFPGIEQRFTDVILHKRNEHLVQDLKNVIKTTGPTATIAVCYGTAHTQGIAAKLQQDLGYSLGTHTWKTVFSVDSPSNDGMASLKPHTMYLLGKSRAVGRLSPKDMQEAVFWWRKAAEKGHIEAQYTLGLVLSHESENSQTSLSTERSIDVNSKEGRRWLLAAAEQGKADAAYVLGGLYEEGLGIAQDQARAVEWYRKAAALDYPEALFKLALMHEAGDGVRRDLSTAITLWEKAANLGHVTSLAILGRSYLLGQRGFPQDTARGLKWCKKAADDGVVEVQAFLGRAYLKGEDNVPQDVRLGIVLLEKAANNGNAVSCMLLGMVYEGSRNGFGVEPNLEKAHAWFRRGAETGDKDAQFTYAMVLANLPLSDKPNFKEAFTWAKRAAAKEHAEAKRLCDALQREMDKQD